MKIPALLPRPRLFFPAAFVLLLIAVHVQDAFAKTIIVFAPHPDDEALMAAGIISNAITNGDTVKVVVVTNGDIGGTTLGYAREGESVSAMGVLGLSEPNVIFLGYGDTSLMTIYRSSSDTAIVTSAAGQTKTYGNRGLGSKDFHNYLFGVPGSYNRQTIRQDIKAILTTFSPDEIYTTSIYDDHPDHQGTYLFVVEALVGLKKQGSSLSTRLHETVIHAPCEFCNPLNHWPSPSFTPGIPFPQPEFLNTTPLPWDRIESIPVPAQMLGDTTNNLKYQVINQYQTQLGPTNGWLFGFVKKNEFFWVKDLPTNLALNASVAVSSENASAGQPGTKAIDGIIAGDPRDNTKEWATVGQLAGAWITLTWSSPVTIAQVNLYDRPNLTDNILGGTLHFSDGSSLPVGALPNNGVGLQVPFPPKTITWVQFWVDSAVGTNIGLAEIEVLGTDSTSTTNHAPVITQGPVAVPSTIDDTQSSTVTVKALDVDGDALQYSWASDGGSLVGAGPTAVFTPPQLAAENLFLVTVTVSDGRGGTVRNSTFIDASPAASAFALTLNPNVVGGGTPSQGTVTLKLAAPPGGAVVALSSSDTSVATVPASVTVPAGATSATFTVTTKPGPAGGVTISASSGGRTPTALLTVVANLAAQASVTVSSENASTGQLGIKAIDGIVDGCTTSNGCTPDHYTKEWATLGQAAGAWIRLTWPSAVTISQVILFDRPNLTDNILAGTLLFSDGSSLPVGTLPNNGAGLPVSFLPKTVTWVQLRVDSAVGQNIGLAEIQVTGPSGLITASALTVTPSSVVGGTSSQGTVTLSGAAPAGGAIVSLASSAPLAAAVPASVTVAAGATSATFLVTTSPVIASIGVTISAASGGVTQMAALTVVGNLAGLASVAVSSENTATGQLGIKAIDGIVDGCTTTSFGCTPAHYTKEWATVGELAGAWIRLTWSSGVTISQVILYDRPNLTDNILAGTLLFSDGSSLPVGALPNDGCGFPLSFLPKTVTWVQFRVDSAVGANIGLAEFEVLGPVGPLTASALTVTPSSVVGGTSSQGTVMLNGAAPAGGAIVSLASSAPSVATVPASVTVAAGAASATFLVTTSAVTASTGVTISASYGGATPTAPLTVTPASASALALNPTSVVGGNPSTGTVTLSGPAPTGGAAVALSSNNPAATVPASVTVAAGATNATFTVTTSAVGVSTGVTISASYGGVTKTATLTVSPLPSASALALNPISVVGGTSSQGTVTLSGPAPTGGAAVALSSNNTAVATVPPSVTVAAGATSATFTVTTSAVAASTTVTISAAYGGVTPTATLTVTLNQPTNIAPQASVTVSSENTATGQLGIKAIDGIVDGCTASNGCTPAHYTKEWATLGQAAGAWIRLTWPSAVTISQVILHDRPNLDDHVLAGTLLFSDGSSLPVGALPNDGTGLPVSFAPKPVTWVQFRVDSAAGTNLGLAEIEVLGPVSPLWASALTITPSSVVGGNSLQGTVTLSGAAPAGGVLVALSSSNPAVATIPGAQVVTVAAGATSATFTVMTSSVTASTGVTLSASYGGVTPTATLTVGKTLAALASVTVSSENTATGQLGIKAIDGIVDGCTVSNGCTPDHYTKEWATLGQAAGAWIRLTWPSAVTLSQVNLYDRPNLNDHVLAGTLLFSDGSSLPVGALPNDGTEWSVSFAPKPVTWVQFRVDSAAGTNLGLAEFEVSGPCVITPSVTMTQPVNDYLQPSPTLAVVAQACVVPTFPSGWGVRFMLDGGVANGGAQFDDTVAPFQGTFTNVSPSEHIIDAWLIDNTGAVVPGSATHDQLIRVGIGDYYVAMGDSITGAYGDDVHTDDLSQDGRNAGGGYEPILNDRLTAAENGRPHTIVDEGVGGTTSGDGVSLMATLLARHPNAQRYLVLYGTNDANPLVLVPSGRGLHPGDAGYAGTYKDHMQQIINAINAAGKTVAVGKVPFANESIRNTRIQEYNLVIDELVGDPGNKLTIPPPDFYTYFAAHYPTEYFDTFHPNGLGYQSMAGLWLQALSAVTAKTLTLSPPSVVGGTPSQGTVTLSGTAPPGGAAVGLASSNLVVATVPASVTVPAGAPSATFTVTTSAVPASTGVTISATSSGVARTATLTATH
jgi:LmbE family N-acetylglucosaminyl deacetylase/lysophospholipase L1-like esterase